MNNPPQDSDQGDVAGGVDSKPKDELVREYIDAARKRDDAPPQPKVDYYEDYRPMSVTPQSASQWPLSSDAPQEYIEDTPPSPTSQHDPEAYTRHTTSPPPPVVRPRDPRHQYIPPPNRGHPQMRGRPYPRGGPPPPHGPHMARGPPLPPPPAHWRGRDRPPPGYRGRPYPRGAHPQRPMPPPHQRPPPNGRPPIRGVGGEPYWPGPMAPRGGPRVSSYSESQYSVSDMGSKQTSPELGQAGFPIMPMDRLAHPHRRSSRAPGRQSDFRLADDDDDDDAAATSPIEMEHRRASKGFGNRSDSSPSSSTEQIAPAADDHSVTNTEQGHQPEAKQQPRVNNLLAPSDSATSQGYPGISRTSASTNSVPSFHSAATKDTANVTEGEKLVFGETVPFSPDPNSFGYFSRSEPTSEDGSRQASMTDSKQNLISASPEKAAHTSNLPTPTFSVSPAPNSLRSPKEAKGIRSPGQSARNSTRQSGMLLSVPERTDVRASTTSLPGLIKRALRLASNLEDGKTSSRLGTDWIKEDAAKEKQRGSLHSVIASFPVTPRGGTPGGGKGMLKVSEWPEEALGQMSKSRREGQQGSRRRICSMPVWLFVLVVLLILGLVIAAILIPVFLVVVPNNNKDNAGNSSAGVSGSTSSSTSGSTSGSDSGSGAVDRPCDGPLTCANGGVNVPSGSSNACICLCTNGFGGPTCANTVELGCSSYTPASGEDGAGQSFTFGSSLPPLITSADSDFSIPLNASLLASLFETGRTSCTSQNALVSFDGITPSKRSVARAEVTRAVLAPRQTVADVNGVLVAVSSDMAALPTLVPGVPNNPSPPSNAALTSSSAQVDINKSFLGTAVLYILQTSQSVSEATSAQTILTSAIQQSSSASSTGLGNVTIPGGWQINVNAWSVTAMGTTVGGNGPS